MSKISLSCCFSQNMTLVPNEFVDGHMSRANGEFVKVYLLLLRLSASGQSFSLSDAADKLSCTEKDILRALRYWENTGVLILSRNVRDEISGVAFAPVGMTQEEASPRFPARQEKKRHPSAGRGAELRTRVQPETSAPKDTLQVPDAAGSPDSKTTVGRDDKNDSAPDADLKPVPSPDFQAGQGQVEDNGTDPDSGLMPTHSPESETEQGRDTKEAAVRHPDASVRNPNKDAAGTPGRKQLTAARITELENTSDFMYLLFVSGQYLGRNLTRRDIDTLGYFFDELHMSADLIEYLIEYCVDIGHTNINYIETVGLSWHAKGVKTIEEAKTVAVNYQKDYFTILKALGIRDHSPISNEIQIMDKWMNDYHFTMDMIQEACSKTIMTIAKPTIHYTDSILTNWFKKGIRTLEDVKNEQTAYRKKGKHYYTILNTLGIQDYSPNAEQKQFIDKWINDYHFSMDIITEACRKAAAGSARQPFTYADKLLTDWFDKKLTTLEDIKKEEEAHKTKRENEKKKKTASRSKGKMPSGSFYHFEQRSYGSDLDDMLMDIAAKANESNEAVTPAP